MSIRINENCCICDRIIRENEGVIRFESGKARAIHDIFRKYLSSLFKSTNQRWIEYAHIKCLSTDENLNDNRCAEIYYSKSIDVLLDYHKRQYND